MQSIDLYEYLEHKAGMPVAEIQADSPERFLVMEEEALRDLVVMDSVSGVKRQIIPGPHTLERPECRRLMEMHENLP